MAARPHLCLVVIGTRHDLVAVGREVKRKHLLDMALHGPNVAPGAAVPQSPFKQGARMCVGGWGVGGWNTFESKRMCISMRTVKSHSRPSRSVYTCLGWNTFKMCMEVCVHEQMYTQACVCVHVRVAAHSSAFTNATHTLGEPGRLMERQAHVPAQDATKKRSTQSCRDCASGDERACALGTIKPGRVGRAQQQQLSRPVLQHQFFHMPAP